MRCDATWSLYKHANFSLALLGKKKGDIDTKSQGINDDAFNVLHLLQEKVAKKSNSRFKISPLSSRYFLTKPLAVSITLFFRDKCAKLFSRSNHISYLGSKGTMKCAKSNLLNGFKV